MSEVLTVLTYKSASEIVEDGGTQSWKISKHRASRCDYVVCVRHQQGPYKAQGDEPHKHAFLVGKVSGIAPSDETKGRFRVEFSEYAIVDGPEVPLVSASPTQYFPSLRSIGIDETLLDWKPVSILPTSTTSSKSSSGSEREEAHQDATDNQSIPPMSVLMRAKKMVADSLQVPMDAVEITIRT